LSYASEKLENSGEIKNDRPLLIQTEETEFKYIKHNRFFVKDFFEALPGENRRFFEPLCGKPKEGYALKALPRATEALREKSKNLNEPSRYLKTPATEED